MRALEAASAGGEGDARCTPNGLPAKSAYLDITWPDGGALHVSIPDVSPSDPVFELRANYELFRAAFPCPEPKPTVHEAERSSEPRAAGCAVGARGNSRGFWALVGLLALGLVRRLRPPR